MSRDGFTLIELILSLLLIGLLSVLAGIRIAGIQDSLLLRMEAEQLAGALEAARGSALRLGTAASLSLSDSIYLVKVRTLSGDSITAWHGQGPARNGVSLSGLGAPLLFSPTGITYGVSNRTITLRRGMKQRQLVVSRLGRVTRKPTS